MNITNVTLSKFNTINFGTRIIDMHAHVGTHENVNYTKRMLDVFTKQPLENNDTVEMMIVSDTDTFKGEGFGEYEGNKKALLAFNGDTNYKFLASCAPHNGNVDNIKKVVNEFPMDFVGLKFHPNDAKLPVTDEKYRPYFEYANENKMPCLFHCHVAVDKSGRLFRLTNGDIDMSKTDPFSDPELIYQAAKKYKETPFIMAHLGSGWRESHNRAIDVLVESVKKGDANLYADISWVDIDAQKNDGYVHKNHIVKAIKKLKGIGDPSWTHGDQSFRLMFGTDAPISRFQEPSARTSYTTFVEEIKNAIRTDRDLAKESEQIIEDLFYNNARKLFFKDKSQTSATNTVNSAQKAGGKTGKILACVAAGIALIGGAAFFMKNRSDNNGQK